MATRTLVTLDVECRNPECRCHAARAAGLAFGHYAEVEDDA